MKTIFFTLLLMPFLGVAQSNSKDLTKKQILKNKNVIEVAKSNNVSTLAVYNSLKCQKELTGLKFKELPLFNNGKQPKLKEELTKDGIDWNSIAKYGCKLD